MATGERAPNAPRNFAAIQDTAEGTDDKPIMPKLRTLDVASEGGSVKLNRDAFLIVDRESAGIAVVVVENVARFVREHKWEEASFNIIPSAEYRLVLSVQMNEMMERESRVHLQQLGALSLGVMEGIIFTRVGNLLLATIDSRIRAHAVVKAISDAVRVPFGKEMGLDRTGRVLIAKYTNLPGIA
jgi:hypothetical protein